MTSRALDVIAHIDDVEREIQELGFEPEPDPDPYPEHTKLLAIKEQSQAIGEFLEFSGYTLCKVMFRAPYNGIGGLSDEPTYADSQGRFVPVMKSTPRLLAEYFGIDADKLEAEKRAMLEDLRRMNAS